MPTATKQRVWIDVTDLQQWSGHLNGVQRVVFENMVRLYNDQNASLRKLSACRSRGLLPCVVQGCRPQEL
jgi:hypothetical protein